MIIKWLQMLEAWFISISLKKSQKQGTQSLAVFQQIVDSLESSNTQAILEQERLIKRMEELKGYKEHLENSIKKNSDISDRVRKAFLDY